MPDSSPFHNSATVPYWRLSSFYFFYFALLGAWLPYWPLYLQERGFSPEKIGYIAGIMVATKIIAPNIWGYVADRTRRRMQVIRMGSLLSCLIFMAIFVRQDFYWLAVVIAGYSFFWNAVLAQFEVATLSHLGGRYQRYSQIRVWGSIGFIIAVATLGLFFDYFPVSWLPWFVAVMLVGIWISSLLVAEHPDERFRTRERKPLYSVLKQPVVIAFFAVCFLLQVSHGPYYTFFSVYLVDHGFSRTVTGTLWSLGVLAEVGVFIVMHQLVRRFNWYQIMMASLVLAMIRWWLIAYFVDHTGILIFAQLLHAASFGSFHAYAVDVVRRVFPEGLQGQGMALYSALSFGAGGAVGAVASGWLWEFDPVLTFVVAGFACLLALMIGPLLKGLPGHHHLATSA